MLEGAGQLKMQAWAKVRARRRERRWRVRERERWRVKAWVEGEGGGEGGGRGRLLAQLVVSVLQRAQHGLEDMLEVGPPHLVGLWRNHRHLLQLEQRLALRRGGLRATRELPQHTRHERRPVFLRVGARDRGARRVAGRRLQLLQLRHWQQRGVGQQHARARHLVGELPLPLPLPLSLPLPLPKTTSRLGVNGMRRSTRRLRLLPSPPHLQRHLPQPPGELASVRLWPQTGSLSRFLGRMATGRPRA